jgi:hypothetical protein
MKEVVKDLKFWSFLLSVIAVVLSQLPPIKFWLADVSLHARVSNQIHLRNTVGLIDFGSQILLTNTGNRALSIRNIELTLESPSKTLTKLRGDSFIELMGDGSTTISYPIGIVELKSGDTWSHYVYFIRNRTPSTLEKLQDLQVRISKDILKKGLEGAFDPRLKEATPDAVKPALEQFNANFDLDKGDYYLTFRFLGQKDQLLAEERLRLPIYDFHLSLLKSQTDEYKYGYGIYLPMIPIKEVIVQSFLLKD